jgi:hypothetical protein
MQKRHLRIAQGVAGNVSRFNSVCGTIIPQEKNASHDCQPASDKTQPNSVMMVAGSLRHYPTFAESA